MTEDLPDTHRGSPSSPAVRIRGTRRASACATGRKGPRNTRRLVAPLILLAALTASAHGSEVLITVGTRSKLFIDSFDHGWVEAGSDRTIQLPPGHHEVVAEPASGHPTLWTFKLTKGMRLWLIFPPEGCPDLQAWYHETRPAPLLTSGRPIKPVKMGGKVVEGLPPATFNVVVDEAGAVVDVHVVGSGHRVAERSVLDAVRTWRFVPCTLDGKPVGVMYTLKVEFTVGGYPRFTLW